MKAYVLIKIRSGEIPEAIRQFRSIKAITSADMTFGAFDAILCVEAKDLSSLGRAVASDIQPVVGVLDTLTCLVVDGV